MNEMDKGYSDYLDIIMLVFSWANSLGLKHPLFWLCFYFFLTKRKATSFITAYLIALIFTCLLPRMEDFG